MIERPSCEEAVLLHAITRVRQGDSDAFEVIYHHCSGRVKNLCRYRLRWMDRGIHFEEDMASEIMTSIWKSLCDPFTTWVTADELWHAIHRLVFEQCIDRARYNTRKKRLAVLELPVLFDELYGHRVWANGVAEVDTRDLLKTLLGKLPDNELTEFVELKLRGLTNDEIANQWRVTVRTVQRKMDTVRQFFDDKFLTGVRT